MNLVTLDLEGVLIPEMWVAFADASGIPELRRTTRDEPDYDNLMRYRLEILSRRGIKLADMRKVIDGLEPVDGAREFLYWLKSRTRVVILSDTFEQFVEPLMRKLDYPALFCHTLEIGADGSIDGYRLRKVDHKRLSVEAFKGLNFKVVSVGDSYNDLSMLRAADGAVLYRPTDAFAAENPDLPVARDYRQLKAAIESYADGWRG